MSKHSGKIGLYLLLIVALIAGYLYLNDQVSTQGSYTMGQLEKALEEDKVTDAVIHQNREVPTGYVTANIVSDGQRTVYVTDVKEAAPAPAPVEPPPAPSISSTPARW